jgi:hypothetical protein
LVTVYQVSQATGSITVNFASDPATCGAGGRCGMTGTETYTAGVARRDESLAVLTTIRGRPRLTTGDIVLASGHSDGSVTLPGGGAPCVDQQNPVPLDLPLSAPSAHRIAVDLVNPALQSPGSIVLGGADPFDLRCPGPRVGDVVTAGSNLATVPLATFRHKTVQLTLNATRQFTSGGFGGTVTAAIQVKLRTLVSP